MLVLHFSSCLSSSCHMNHRCSSNIPLLRHDSSCSLSSSYRMNHRCSSSMRLLRHDSSCSLSSSYRMNHHCNSIPLSRNDSCYHLSWHSTTLLVSPGRSEPHFECRPLRKTLGPAQGST